MTSYPSQPTPGQPTTAAQAALEGDQAAGSWPLASVPDDWPDGGPAPHRPAAGPAPFLHPDPGTGPQPVAGLQPVTGPHLVQAVGAAGLPAPDGSGRPDPGAAAGAGTGGRLPAAEADCRWAMLSYLGIPFFSFVPPLAVYLIRLRTPFSRRHAAQALNLAITILLYNLSAVIIGGVLALDALRTALLIVTPVTAALWLVALAYLARCALDAGRGEFRPIPAWLCATLAR